MNNSATQKTKLVVFKEHTLGYIMPEFPNDVFVLRAYEKRGATNHEVARINTGDSVRLASEKDFDFYRVSFDGFKTDAGYEYASN